ncbi:MAG TPA: hypothetical protein VHX64_19100 [Caulobacteraceae bacterium]|jgi:hypothetical protein|nr:hypothetical protein [Caulobacteraceae bacterium]
MADETQDEIQRRLLKLHGQMMAFAEAVRVIGEESAKVAAFDGAGPDAPHELRLASAEAIAALSVEAVRACAIRINGLFEGANAEFEEIKTKLAPGRSFSTH